MTGGNLGICFVAEVRMEKAGKRRKFAHENVVDLAARCAYGS